MLYIIEHNKVRVLGAPWNMGEPLPTVLPDTRTITIEADGAELDYLLGALGIRRATPVLPLVGVNPIGNFG